MSRRIITTQLQANEPARLDAYKDRLLKYIPADVVAAWQLVVSLIEGDAGAPRGAALWAAFFAGLIVTFLWTWRTTTLPNRPPAITQTVISTISFATWVFALGGPFETLDWYRPLFGSLVLILFALLAAIYAPPEG